MYAFQRSESGHFISRSSVESWGSLNAINEGDPCYQLFAHLLQRKTERSQSSEDIFFNDILLEDTTEVFQYCCGNGLMLARKSEPKSLILERGFPFYADGYSAKFYPLMMASGAKKDGDLYMKLFDGVKPRETGIWVPEPVLDELDQMVADEETDFRKLINIPFDRSFLYVDVSDFSKMPAGHQALTINAISGMVRDWNLWGFGDNLAVGPRSYEAMLCIGDGYIFVFREADMACLFGACLAGLIEDLVAHEIVPVDFHFRMGLHCGPVYCFYDPGRKDWNYIGEGINGGQRVIGVIDKGTDDVFYISSEVRKRVRRSKNEKIPVDLIIRNCQNRGRRRDKHKVIWRVYEVNHTEIHMQLNLPRTAANGYNHFSQIPWARPTDDED
jgi:hypothetical protein